ncbi:MAG TPA: hypothetical protein VGI63_07525, partial [Verrucomicrobiae bacterium]
MANNQTRMWGRGFLIWLVLPFCGTRMFASVSTEPPVINSISVAGTNLDFVATFPPGVASSFLEMRPALTEKWQSVAALNVPAAGGIVEFFIPMPELSSVFFRLNISMQTTTNALI